MSAPRPGPRFVLRLLAALALGAALLFGGAAAYLHRHPDWAQARLEAAISTALPGGSFSAGSIRPLLWPAPGVRLTDCLLRAGDGAALFVARAECRLSWLHLFRGRLIPALLELDQPALIAALPLARARNASPPPSALSRTSSPALPLETLSAALPLETLSAALPGLKLRVTRGQLTLFPAGTRLTTPAAASRDAATLALDGLDGMLRLPGLLRPGALELRLTGLTQRLAASPALPRQLRALTLTLDDLRPAPGWPGMLPASGRLAVEGGQTRARLELDAAVEAHAVQGTLRLDGQLQPNRLLSGLSGLSRPGQPASDEPVLPLRVQLPFRAENCVSDTGLRLPQALHITDSSLQLDADNLRFSGVWTPNGLRGKANVAQFSLPRWFAFARALPNGLARTLDRLSGELDFVLTSQGLDVPGLVIHVGGATFTGNGAVPSFAAPVIRITGSAPAADLGRIMPELNGDKPEEPRFAGPALRFADTPARPATGFDIRLQAAQSRLRGLRAGHLDIAITPGPDGARLAVALRELYGGTLHTDMAFGPVKSVALTARDLRVHEFLRALIGAVPVRGTLDADASLRGAGNAFGQWLAGLAGTASASIRNGQLLGSTELPFDRLGLSFDGRGVTPAGTSLPPFTVWDGKWRWRLDLPALGTPPRPAALSLDLNGPLTVSSATGLPVRGDAVPATGAARLAGLPVSLSGALSFSVPEARASLAKLSVQAAGVAFRGDLAGTLRAGAWNWHARGEAACPQLRELLRRLDLLPDALKPAALRRLTLRGELAHTPGNTRLTIASGQLDDTSLHGTLTHAPTGWDVDLALGSIIAERYLPPAPPKRAARPSAARPQNATAKKTGSARTGSAPDKPAAGLAALPARLGALALHGVLRAETLQLANVTLTKVRVPLRVRDGHVTAAPITAACYGGRQEAAFSLAPHPAGAKLLLDCALRDVDLGQATARLSDNMRLRGKGRLNLATSGLILPGGDVLTALDGTWDGHMGRGSYVRLEPKTRKITGRYELEGISASGTLKAGLLACDNLLIHGPKLTLRGKGTINLAAETINYAITASLPGLPDIPVTYTGSIADPTRSINLTGVFSGLFDSIGKSLFSFMGDVLTAPLKLFK